MSNENSLKAQLIEQLGSQDAGIAGNALYQLNKYDWLGDDSLRNAKLAGANLFEAFLNFGLDFNGADLSRTTLYHADLQDSNFEGASFIEADMRGSYLFGTNLLNANLRGANLEDAWFNEDTILPDGSHGTDDTDMRRFTDPDYPDFWDAEAKTGQGQGDD